MSYFDKPLKRLDEVKRSLEDVVIELQGLDEFLEETQDLIDKIQDALNIDDDAEMRAAIEAAFTQWEG